MIMKGVLKPNFEQSKDLPGNIKAGQKTPGDTFSKK